MKTPKKRKANDPAKAKAISDQSVEIAQWAATTLIAAEQWGLKDRPLEHFFLSPGQRDVLLLIPGISTTIETKLAKKRSSFTAAEVGGMMMAVAEELLDSEDRKRLALLVVVQHLIEGLKEGVVPPEKPKQSKSEEPKVRATSATLFQFKITLLGIEPPIWRRIQTKDCTLDTLHEHIQTAMGWMNSHLHQFEIDGVRHGDPELLCEGFDDETPPVNSRRTKLSKILPKDGKQFRFEYEYDFGDGWEHEVLFEGFLPVEKGIRYPLCVEGERACPPDDVGGTHGYQDYLKAMENPKHKRHKEFLEWRGPFDPEKFDAEAATKEMRKGLPDWREMK